MLGYNYFTLQLQFINSASFADVCPDNDFGKSISLGYLQDIYALRRRNVSLLINLFHQNS